MHGSARLVAFPHGRSDRHQFRFDDHGPWRRRSHWNRDRRAVAGEPIDRLAANLAESYRVWLLVN